ncbi:Homeodomain-like protein, partial [Dimargaris cristalligena]
MFKRRYRATPSQVRLLETYFIEDETPDAGRREFIAQHADMPVKSVHIWFQNRRAK